MLRSEFTSPIESIIDTIVLTLGEVTVAYEIVEFPSSYAIIGAVGFKKNFKHLIIKF